jgi:hypothetical protein
MEKSHTCLLQGKVIVVTVIVVTRGQVCKQNHVTGKGDFRLNLC